MSNEGVRKISVEDIQLVQNLIEQCIQLNMSQKEVINKLLVKDKIEPVFTELVWQKLEEQNPDFFKVYHLGLLVNDNIMQFNRLLERQVELTNQLSVGPYVSHIPLLSQNSACSGQEYIGSTLQAGDMQQPLESSLYSNAGSSIMHMQETVDISNMLMTQSSNTGLVQGMNGQMIRPKTGYINDSPCMFGPNGNVLDACQAAGEMLESHAQPINNNTLLGSDVVDDSLGQIPRSASLSDLTEDTPLGSDLWESYTRSPFLEASPDRLDPQLWVEQQDLDKVFL